MALSIGIAITVGCIIVLAGGVAIYYVINAKPS
jgi:hypothetical protein